MEDLGATRISLDDAGEFTPGYSAKLLCQPPMRAIGKDSLPKLLKATGMVLVLVIDDERFAEIKSKLIKRKKTVRAVARIKRVKGYFTKENAAKCAEKRWKDVPDHIRSRLARKAIRARWRGRKRRAGTLLESQAQSSCANGQAITQS